MPTNDPPLTTRLRPGFFSPADRVNRRRRVRVVVGALGPMPATPRRADASFLIRATAPAVGRSTLAAPPQRSNRALSRDF